MDDNRLSMRIALGPLLRFAAPSTIMMVFMSLYQMVDAVFVSNFVGEEALSALNIAYPVPSVIIALSIMLSTGGSAVVARTMGEGKADLARRRFSLLIATGTVLGLLVTVLGLALLDPIIHLLGATEKLYGYCHDYLVPLLLVTLLAVFQMLFQTFFVTAGKPQLGLITTVIGGLSNVVFDYVFIVLCDLGVAGAALGTALGYAVPGLFGLFYFLFYRKGTLFLVRPRLDWGFLGGSCANGSSEMVTNLAVAITTYLFNILMLRYMGEDGVAAITIILYAQFLMTSVFMGFSGGVAPLISYNYGKGDEGKLRQIFRISIGFVGVVSLVVFGCSYLFEDAIISIFVRAGTPVFALTRYGFSRFSISYLFTGLNIFASALFTAFSNGLVSAALSFLRTFVFLVGSLLLLPLVLEGDGLWFAVPVAEALAFLCAIFSFLRWRKVYHYC